MSDGSKLNEKEALPYMKALHDAGLSAEKIIEAMDDMTPTMVKNAKIFADQADKAELQVELLKEMRTLAAENGGLARNTYETAKAILQAKEEGLDVALKN